MPYIRIKKPGILKIEETFFFVAAWYIQILVSRLFAIALRKNALPFRINALPLRINALPLRINAIALIVEKIA